MNTEGDKEEHCSETEGKVTIGTNLEAIEAHVKVPFESPQDGSGDHISPSETKPVTPGDTPDDMTENVTTDLSETSKYKEIGDGENKKGDPATIDHEEGSDIICDSTNITVKNLKTATSSNLELIVPEKPKFLECVTSLASEDVDSENQDEDLVLKWDDDDEDDPITCLKDDEIDKNLDAKTSDVTKENLDEKLGIIDVISKDVDLTESIEPATSTDDTIIVSTEPNNEDDVIKATESKAADNLIETMEPEMIQNDDVIVSTKSKAINNFNESMEPETINDDDVILSAEPEAIDDLIESMEPQKVEGDNVIESVESKAIDDLIESMEPQTNKVDDVIESTEAKASKDDDLTELAEPKTSEDSVDEDQEDLLSEIDAQIAELGASLSKAENEKLMNIQKTNESAISIETNVSALEEIISLDNTGKPNKLHIPNEISQLDSPPHSQLDKQHQIKELETESYLKDDENDEIADKLEMSSIEVEEALKDNDKGTSDNLEQTKYSENQMDVDTINMTKDVERTTNDSEIEIDDSNLTLDQNQERDVGILANSTKLDNSSVMETSANDSFAHDSDILVEDRTHKVNKPDVMLEIPTQELIDLDETLSQTKDMSTDENEIQQTSVDSTGLSSVENSKSTVMENEIDDKQNVLETTDPNLNKNQMSIDTVPKNVVTKEETTSASDNKTNTCADVEIKTTNESNLAQDETKSLDTVKLDDENKTKENIHLPEVNTTVAKDGISTENISNLLTDPAGSSKTINQECDDSLLIANKKDDFTKDSVDVQPSTSQMALQQQEPSDDAAEVTEATDSLGLLAESSRVRDDDDVDCDDQETSDHDDYDDDFDQDDESSNQLTAEHSEDSAQHSESDMPKPNSETDTATDKQFGQLDSIDKETDESKVVKDVDDMKEDETVSKESFKENEEKEEGFGIEISNVVSEDKDGDAEIDIDDEIVCEEVELSSDHVGDSEQPTEEVDTSALQDKVADTPATQEIPFKVHTESKLRQLLKKEAVEDQTKSPSKKKLEIVKPKHVVNIVDLESSSEDEGVLKPESKELSKEVEVSSGDDSRQGETVSTLQKLTSRLNSELTIKTASATESTLIIPETKMGEIKADAPPPAPAPSKFGGLEVFNLDSDEEDTPPAPPREPTPEPEPEPEPEKPPTKCINSACTSDSSVSFYPASASTAKFYECNKKRRAMVCEVCLYRQLERAQKLVDGIRNYTPLLELEEARSSQDLVEISDSDSDDEGTSDPDAAEKLGAERAGLLEQQLADMINATWERFQMDARLKDAQDELVLDLERLEKESAEVNQMLDECQVATDKLRSELYATFEVQRHQLPGIVVYDTPEKFYACPEAQGAQQQNEFPSKRRLSSASESQSKKPAIPLGTAADAEKLDIPIAKLEEPKTETDTSKKEDDDKDISVVTLAAEAAPEDLPPTGDLVRPPLQTGQAVFAMRHAFGSWIKARVLEITPKGSTTTAQNFTMCRVKFDNKSSRNAYKLLPARCLAYCEPATVRMTIGTRVIALFKDTSADKSGKRESFYSGVVAEVPNPVNKYRYLVFFDDGYAQYVSHSDTRLVCEFSALVWEEVHPFSREFVREYLLAYPERPMVRLHTGQSLKTEWNGKWWLSRVIQVDASLAQVYFEQDKRAEWIYRGSTRLAPLYLELQAAEKHRARPMPRNRAQNKLNMPYVEYTRLDEQQEDPAKSAEAQIKAQQEEIRRQRAVAKKSTTPQSQVVQQPAGGNLDAVTSRVVYYTPKNAVKPYKMTTHTCGPKCKRTDVLALKDLRTYNPLAKPLLSGWERQIVRYKGHKEVMYRAPCGRRLRNMAELHRYLRTVHSDMGVDLFDFGPNTHCLAEFVLNKCIVGKKDLSHGKENVPVPCVNYYDDSLPEFCSYNTERTPTAGVPLNLDPEFLCGCDCTDDCQDKSKCACWKMTQEGARTIGLDPRRVGYVYKRLPDPLPSGIYECNVRCKCRSTCLNRVAQHPLQLKLQVFKTLNRGWGIRALNDVPKGSFLCIYAGNLLTDATANLDGLNEGDEYLAELDYIEVVEQMKEGYEDDIPEQDKKLDRKELGKAESESEETESEEEAANSKSDADDGDFEPGYIPGVITGFNKRLRKRDRKKQKDKENGQKDKDATKENEDDCITISDDEELREPSSFAAQAGMGAEFISKYRSVRTLFGKDEACYIMDAKVQGNIGRYLNHSCSPNIFVQNVFVDTHDPRFPWVAFFALNHIRAGTELTWNYNYDVGSVPGKALYCYCGAPNCRGRLL